jgi:hypothetical protein
MLMAFHFILELSRLHYSMIGNETFVIEETSSYLYFPYSCTSTEGFHLTSQQTSIIGSLNSILGRKNFKLGEEAFKSHCRSFVLTGSWLRLAQNTSDSA